MRRRVALLLAVLAVAVLGAGTGLLSVTAASAQPGPFSFVSAASSSYGMDDVAGTWTDGTAFTSISPSGTSGNVELAGANGQCLTYSSATSTIDGPCSTTSTKDLWQVYTHSGVVVIVNVFYDGANTRCPWNGGHTQAVLTAASQGGGLTEACDNSPNGTAWPYGTNQEWTESPPVAPSPSATSPSPSPTSPSPSPTPPSPGPSSSSPPPVTVSCTTPSVVVPAPDGVPSGHVGALITNLTGAQVAAAFDPAQTMFDGPHTNAVPPSADTAGDAVLTTNGATDDQAMLSSCPFTGTGADYLHGTFEARLDIPDNGSGQIANWPAFWLSGMNCRSDTPQPVATATEPGCWPQGGEFDIMEGLGGSQQAHYFYGDCAGSPCGSQASSPVPGLTGWHTFDAQWGPGYVAVYIDGTLEWSYTSANVESDVPLQVMFDMAGTGSGVQSTLLVQYLRVWAWQ